jgi:nucleoside-diphosphate-sugar epimerase
MDFDFSGKRILVIGGTGFVGSRLIERLVVEHGAKVRAIVRNYATAVRIARFPIEMIHGDITVSEDVNRAVEGCDIVFHCAYGNTGSGDQQRQVTVDGTRNIVSSAHFAGITRLVYLSTLSVYGRTVDGDLDEGTARKYSGGYYADTKLDAEKIVQQYSAKGLSCTTLQPTIIYGPYGPLWTVGILERLKNEGVTIIGDGDGLCNIVYIDDVITSMMLAATEKTAVGETFLISGDKPVTWRRFYEAYERMLGSESRIISVSAKDAKSNYKKAQRQARIVNQLRNILRENELIRNRIIETPEATKLLRTVRSLLPPRSWTALKRQVKGAEDNGLPIKLGDSSFRPVPEVIHPLDVDLAQTKTWVRIDKARRILNYDPQFGFERGMKVTEQWARWANLLS